MRSSFVGGRTLFANQTVVAIVGVVGVAGNRAPTVAHDSNVEF